MGYTGSDLTIIQFEIKKSYQLLWKSVNLGITYQLLWYVKCTYNKDNMIQKVWELFNPFNSG